MSDKSPSQSVHKTIYLVASGDLRLAANRTCWPAQADMERRVTDAFVQRGRDPRARPPLR